MFLARALGGRGLPHPMSLLVKLSCTSVSFFRRPTTGAWLKRLPKAIKCFNTQELFLPCTGQNEIQKYRFNV